MYFPTEQLAAQGLDPGQVVGIKVRGDSMDGTLADGNWVLVDRSSRAPKGCSCYSCTASGASSACSAWPAAPGC
ncbi:hypothetical protein CVH10_16625 [Halomonas sp. ND22Bw]|nr:hypothetical protein CVH10_16625 [Halomonas sp. ND22Bw]